MPSIDVSDAPVIPGSSGMVVRLTSEIGQSQAIVGAPVLLCGGVCTEIVTDTGVADSQATPTAHDLQSRALVRNYPAAIRYFHDFTTAPTTDTVQDISIHPMGIWAMQVVGVGGTPTAWDARLEISLDGTNFHALLQHVSGTNPLNVMVFPALTAIAYPAAWFRLRVPNSPVALNLNGATALRVLMIGVPA